MRFDKKGGGYVLNAFLVFVSMLSFFAAMLRTIKQGNQILTGPARRRKYDDTDAKKSRRQKDRASIPVVNAGSGNASPVEKIGVPAITDDLP
jgi:hypothetical protein